MDHAVQYAHEPVTQARGLYRCAVRVHGRHPYYAVTSLGKRLEPLRPRHYETDAEVVVMLAELLDQVDPVLPVLRLVREVTPAARRSPSSERPRFWMHGQRPLAFGRGQSPRR